jgi:hypothetical protein
MVAIVVDPFFATIVFYATPWSLHKAKNFPIGTNPHSYQFLEKALALSRQLKR